MAVLGFLGQWLLAAGASAGVDVPQDVECLALTIYFEARGESDTGQLAVAHVVMNRVADPLFPAAVCNVVQQGGKLALGCQFTWWCDELSDVPTDRRAWERSQALARRVYWNYSKDPTAGALWYHADYVTPYWRRGFTQGPKIGRHIFYWPEARTKVSASSLDRPADLIRR
ncbi:MAG TPA: cell wall hydrolase [Kiloniellales bacterium]